MSESYEYFIQQFNLKVFFTQYIPYLYTVFTEPAKWRN